MTKDELLKRINNNHKHYPPQTQKRIDNHQRVRHVTAECARSLVEVCPVSRELSLALTALEEAMFWANSAVARNENEAI